MNGAEFRQGDRLFQQWEKSPRRRLRHQRRHVCRAQEVAPGPELPDLFCMSLLARFEGYFPGLFETDFGAIELSELDRFEGAYREQRRHGDFAVHRSAGPAAHRLPLFRRRQRPDGQDLDAVVDGVKFVRGHQLGVVQTKGSSPRSTCRAIEAQSDEELREFVRDNAWGHHASCTCPIGPKEKGGVLSSDFRVHGTQGLRVVDASVFPRIPGFFIVSAVYMIGEKAADVILAERSDRQRI